MKKEYAISYLDHFLFSMYILFFVSVVFSLRAISSLSIGLILVIGPAGNQKISTHFIHNRGFAFFLISCSLLFILQCFALSYTHNLPEGIRLLQRSSGIVFIPFAVFSTHKFLAEKFQKISLYFVLILCAGSLYCLAAALGKYFAGAPVSILFYYDLVKPLSQHAIQFAILVFIALLFLIENLKDTGSHFQNLLSHPMIAFLSLILVLLSSKLVISIYVLYLLYFFFNKKIQRAKNIVFIPFFVATVVISIVMPNPIGNRFREMFTGNSMLFVQDKFSPDIYFNGVQFRLLEWKFTYEVLNQQHAWLTGLTPGDAQSFLDKKYVEANMYTGVPGTQNHGYLGYHTHNQFLQASLENGLPAFFVLLFIFFALFKIAIESKRRELKWFALLLLAYCFTDAPLETQYGIVIFAFFPLFLYMAAPPVNNVHPPFKQFSRKPIKTVALEQPD